MSNESSIQTPNGMRVVDWSRLDAAGQRAALARPGERGSLPAFTSWRAVATGPGVTLLAVTAATGRMHQVRAHLAASAAPLLGDPLYGGPTEVVIGGERIAIPLPFLHADQLVIPTPAGPLDLRAPLPADRAALLARLGIRAG
jgi:23S rRNA-/tRNA-specific pseudouridylate synthase